MNGATSKPKVSDNIGKASVLELTPSDIEFSTVPERPASKTRNKWLKEKVVGVVSPVSRHDQGTHIAVQIKAGVGFPTEVWRIPYGIKVKIPRYVKEFIQKDTSLHEFKSNPLTIHFGSSYGSLMNNVSQVLPQYRYTPIDG